jgi:hypothetical protein
MNIAKKSVPWGATKREPCAWGYNRATLFLGDINTGDLALQVRGVSNLRQ